MLQATTNETKITTTTAQLRRGTECWKQGLRKLTIKLID